MNFIFVFKHRLTSVNIFFCLLKTHFLKFAHIVHIIIRDQKYWCFTICATDFLCWYNFIHCIVIYGVLFFLPVNTFPGYGDFPVVLSRPTLSVLSSDVTQDLPFFWRISGSVDEIDFCFSRWAIYKPFYVLVRSLTLIGVSPWQGGFSSVFPAVNSTAGVCPVSFL